jgi:hypothetical protein
MHGIHEFFGILQKSRIAYEFQLAMIGCTTSPCTSVSRMSRPPKR